MLEEFSAGYYIGQFHVTPCDGDYAVMDRDQHVEANEDVYAIGEPVERLDHPLVMKMGNSYFPVFAAEDVAKDTLGLPDDMLEATQIDYPTVKAVFVAKAVRAAQFLDWWTPYTIQEPDFA